MPYDVSGWIEILWDHTLEDEKQEWSGVINLNRFCLSGDYLSSLFFGLAKSPAKEALFVNRGVPDDCSSHVAEEVRQNEDFIKKHGEGDFGHTYALWSEIKPHLNNIDKKELAESEWKLIFEIINLFVKPQFQPEWIRFVVWGNW